ncbi:hypothetical protein THTE_2230 [Thermogutta terrifontis]|uniref:Uncharacterized protein n=1 Tax=Thermogutta terrifontis TaxID=1331910 RepID=A0A286RFX4_9BACT|nr:hypothetical protein THTE_2230 [Thermogutta terrifontis]
MTKPDLLLSAGKPISRRRARRACPSEGFFGGTCLSGPIFGFCTSWDRLQGPIPPGAMGRFGRRPSGGPLQVK